MFDIHSEDKSAAIVMQLDSVDISADIIQLVNLRYIEPWDKH